MAPRSKPAQSDDDWGSSPPDPSGNDLMALDEPQTDVDRVAALIQQSSGLGRASVKIYKIENGKSVYCDSYQPSDFEEGDYSMIRDQYGPGTYKVMLYGTNAAGNFGLMARSEITLAESRIPKRLENPIASNDGLSQVIAMLADGQAKMLETLTALKSAPSKDPMEEMGKMLVMMKTMREALGLDSTPPKSGVSEAIAMVRELRGVADELIPEKQEPDNLLGMMPKVLELIQAGMAAQQAPALSSPTTQLPAVTLPQSLQTNPIQSTNPTDEQMNLMQLATLKTQLNELLAMSDANKTPQEGAQFIHDNVPDESIDDLLDMLEDDQWLQMLGVMDTRVFQHQKWLGEVRPLVLAMFPEEPDTNAGNLATS